MNDKEFLQWIHQRLQYKYGENPNVDFMIRLESIIAAECKELDKSVNSIDWLSHLEWLKQLTYNYGHDEYCSGRKGPTNEGWLEADECDCWHKEIWDFIEANMGDIQL